MLKHTYPFTVFKRLCLLLKFSAPKTKCKSCHLNQIFFIMLYFRYWNLSISKHLHQATLLNHFSYEVSMPYIFLKITYKIQSRQHKRKTVLLLYNFVLVFFFFFSSSTHKDTQTIHLLTPTHNVLWPVPSNWADCPVSHGTIAVHHNTWHCVSHWVHTWLRLVFLLYPETPSFRTI